MVVSATQMHAVQIGIRRRARVGCSSQHRRARQKTFVQFSPAAFVTAVSARMRPARWCEKGLAQAHFWARRNAGTSPRYSWPYPSPWSRFELRHRRAANRLLRVPNVAPSNSTSGMCRPKGIRVTRSKPVIRASARTEMVLQFSGLVSLNANEIRGFTRDLPKRKHQLGGPVNRPIRRITPFRSVPESRVLCMTIKTSSRGCSGLRKARPSLVALHYRQTNGCWPRP